MKKYIAPELQVIETEVFHMVAESLNINSTTIDGNNALSKEGESTGWEIWK